MFGIFLKFYGLGLFAITLVCAARPDLAAALHDLAWLMYAPGYFATMLANVLEVPYANTAMLLAPAFGASLSSTTCVMLFVANIALFMLVVLARGLFLMPDTAVRAPQGILALPLWLYFIGIMAFGLIMTILSHG